MVRLPTDGKGRHPAFSTSRGLLLRFPPSVEVRTDDGDMVRICCE